VAAAATATATRRHFNARQAETLQRIIEAAREELREVGFEEMTVRTVASRASVAPATAYTYFSSKNHLVVEMFWRHINERGRKELDAPTAIERVCAVFDDLAHMLAAEPELGHAVSMALLGPEPDVKQLQLLIGTEINARVAAAAAPHATPEVLDALALAWSGAMLHAGMGHFDYLQMGERLDAATTLIMAGTL
jgi:AcrR family transcriptional regulator